MIAQGALRREVRMPPTASPFRRPPVAALVLVWLRAVAGAGLQRLARRRDARR